MLAVLILCASSLKLCRYPAFRDFYRFKGTPAICWVLWTSIAPASLTRRPSYHALPVTAQGETTWLSGMQQDSSGLRALAQTNKL